MKTTLLFSLLVATFGSNAMANFNLAHNQKAVVCYGEDNQSWDLNAKRTTLKYTVEGESLGSQKITKTDTDGETFVSYTTSEGTLYLDDQGDSFQFKGEQEAQEVRCK
jgi:hypothetical protein